MKKFTHKGRLRGDARSPDIEPWVRLRETKNFWVTPNGSKFRKSSGRGMGDWPMWSLDTETVTLLGK